MQQQSVMEEGTAYEPPTYDETFPVLPESSSSNSGQLNIFSINNSLQLGRITITQVKVYLSLFRFCILLNLYILFFSFH